MDKSYRRNIVNRQRKNYYGYKKYNPRGKSRKSSIYKKILMQILVSILVVLLIILFKSIDSSITNNTYTFISKAMCAEFDYKESVEKIKEYSLKLKDYTIESIPAFNKYTKEKELQMSQPIQGVVISSYGENYDSITEKNTFQRGIDIKSGNMKIVKSVDDGIIEIIGESESLGKFIKINHSNNVYSLYSNLEKIYVKESEKIIRGQRIGELGNSNNSYLHFELWIDDNLVDPELYIDYSTVSI